MLCVWLFVACKMDVENGILAKRTRCRAHIQPCAVENENKQWQKKKNTNKRKINDFQQNLLSINLSSEAVVDVTAAAYFQQNLN